MKLNTKRRHAPPKAAPLIESLRGLGYSTETALSDIIDNSISARATKVEIEFSWNNSNSFITMLDDGIGMTDLELDFAMRLGEKNPLEERNGFDLGRFGMGLKTASFSQCRRLTVASKKNGYISCLRWDLDLIASSEDDGWYLLEGAAVGSEKLLAPLDQITNGTIVLWENLDRIITPSFLCQDFLDLMDKVERHLSMVFHRYLSKSQEKFSISINNRLIQPWDPFMIENMYTWMSPIERISSESGKILVQCFILPHKDKISSKEYELNAGPDGWTAQQGFYIYRNERLLVAGSWLGLGQGRLWTKEESYSLVRIKLDITNTSDIAWKIDVRKSTARPPVSVRNNLINLAVDARRRARKVFAHRGSSVNTTSSCPVAQVWQATHLTSGIRYQIDLNHPCVKDVLDGSGDMEPLVRSMIRIIEDTIPVQRIWLDTAESHEVPQTGISNENIQLIKDAMLVMYKNMIQRKNYTPKAASDRLRNMEPFHNYPDLIATIDDEFNKKENNI